LLAGATGQQLAEVLTTLVELAGADLVRHDSHGFATAHDLVAETIREHLDDVSRARLHHLLARELTGCDGPPDELARHLAGAGDVTAAGNAFAAAASDRLRTFAYDEAAQLAEEGLALGPVGNARLSLLEVRAEPTCGEVIRQVPARTYGARWPCPRRALTGAGSWRGWRGWPRVPTTWGELRRWSRWRWPRPATIRRRGPTRCTRQH
jgi:hypothetical protein